MTIRSASMYAVIMAFVVARLSAQTPAQNDDQLRSAALRAHALEVRRQLPGATMATVDSLLALYSDSVVYEHPSVGAVVRGKADLRSGMERYLGSRPTADATPPRVTIAARAAVLELPAGLDPRNPTQTIPVSRRAIRVLEFDARGLIVRVIDYPW